MNEKLIDLQCDLFSQTDNLEDAIESNNPVELTNALFKWLELKDIVLNGNKVDKIVNKESLKTKFWFEVNTEEQLKLFNYLFDKLYYAKDKIEVLEQFLISAQCQLFKKSEELKEVINSDDSVGLTNILFKWMEIRDVISYGVQIKNMINQNVYMTKFGITVNSEEQLELFNVLFAEMKESQNKEQLYEEFLLSIQCRLVKESERLQDAINSGDSVELTNVLYKWMEIRDTILFGVKIKNMLNKDSYKTKFGIIVDTEEQLVLFNNMFEELLNNLIENNVFQR